MIHKVEDDDLVMGLVDQALTLPAEEREAYVHSACESDSELFEVVWDYVQSELEMKEFLPRPVWAYLPWSMLDWAPSEPMFHHGDLLAGRFRIVRQVGEGGMGMVFEAEDERLRRRIALKCAKPGFGNRLPPEVRHAREINHPNVCRIFDIHTASTAQGEIDFLTMEFLDGETLAARLRAGPLREGEARAFAAQLCAGLAEAHRNLVIHGDLKSNNIILTSTPHGAVRAVITDFGLARRPSVPVNPDDPRQSLQSAPIGGAPDYMAPELHVGANPSTASDVYALGVILHEMVAGKRPENSTGQQSMLKPRAPQKKWSGIIAQCLNSDPAQRFEDAGRLLEALRQPRAPVLPIGAAAAVLLAVSGPVMWREDTVRLALLPFQSDQDTAQIATEMSRGTAVQLAHLKGSAQTTFGFIPESEVVRKQVGSAPKAGELLSATHTIRATLEKQPEYYILLLYLTDTKSGVDTKERTLQYKPAQLKYAPVAIAGFVTSSFRLPHIGSKATVNEAAREQYLTGLSYVQDIRPDDAIKALHRAVVADPDSPLTYAALAEAQWIKCDRTGDTVWKDQALESVRQAELRDPDLPEVHMISGWLKENSVNHRLAEADFQRIIDLQPDNGDAYRRLGFTYESDGFLNEALSAYKKAVQVKPNDYLTHWALGGFYIGRSQYREAMKEFKETVCLKPDLEPPHRMLGQAFFELRNFSEAESELQKAIALGSSSEAETLLATVLSDTRRYKEAEDHYLLAIKLGPETATLWTDLGLCYSLEGRKRDAGRAFYSGFRAARKALLDNPKDSRERANLAYLEARLGNKGAARFDIDLVVQDSVDDDTLQIAVLTYEALKLRDQSLKLLAKFPSILRQINSLPELAGLHRDEGFKELLTSKPHSTN